MSVAQTCKRCPKFNHDTHYCEQHKKKTSKWQDWCEWRRKEWEAWRLLQ